MIIMYQNGERGKIMSENTNFTMQTLYSSKENLKILSGTINALEVETQIQWVM